MRKHRGWIALDIDGTITDTSHQVPHAVAVFLHELYEQGWEPVFITGRTFSFGCKALHVFTFPYYLAVQNGADILHMPMMRLVSRTYLDSSIIAKLENLYAGIQEDFIVYTGFEHGDFCYFRPKKFSNALLAHLHKIMPLSSEPWQEVDHFDFAPDATFPLIKALGDKETMTRLRVRLQTLSECAVALMRDPLDADRIYLNLVTRKDATKGQALLRIIKETQLNGPIIAAGDDQNDISMLEVAQVKIVMQTAPESMHAMADLLAKPAYDHGIIEALQKAIAQCP